MKEFRKRQGHATGQCEPKRLLEKEKSELFRISVPYGRSWANMDISLKRFGMWATAWRPSMTSKIFRCTVFVAVVVLLCSLGIFSVDMRRFQTAPSLGFEWTDRRQNFPRKMYGNMDSPPGKRGGTPLTLSMGSVDGSFVFTDSLARHFPECLFYSPGAQIPQPAGHNGTCKPDGLLQLLPQRR